MILFLLSYINLNILDNYYYSYLYFHYFLTIKSAIALTNFVKSLSLYYDNFKFNISSKNISFSFSLYKFFFSFLLILSIFLFNLFLFDLSLVKILLITDLLIFSGILLLLLLCLSLISLFSSFFYLSPNKSRKIFAKFVKIFVFELLFPLILLSLSFSILPVLVLLKDIIGSAALSLLD